MTKSKVIEKKQSNVKKSGTLLSKLQYPVFVIYNKENIRVSPRERKKIEDVDKLGSLPSGIELKVNKEVK